MTKRKFSILQDNSIFIYLFKHIVMLNHMEENYIIPQINYTIIFYILHLVFIIFINCDIHLNY